MEPSNSVNYVGQRPLDWTPALAPKKDDDGNVDAKAPSTFDPRFLAFVEADLAGLDDVEEYEELSPTERADRKATLVAIRTLILDSDTSSPTQTTGLAAAHWKNLPDSIIKTYVQALVVDAEKQLKAWKLSVTTETTRLTATATAAGSGSGSSSGKRDAADRSAQKTVPKWYGSCCVLTGTAKPQAAHIIPVRAKHVNHKETWRMLQNYLPLPDIEGLEVAMHGQERENILPITHTLHAFWDLYYFALRPVTHPDDPTSTHRLYVQVVWLKDPNGNRIPDNADWQHARFGGGCDFRRAIKHEGHEGRDPGDPVGFTELQNGTVFELVTTDPAACPLPNAHFLHIQYGVHRMMAGIQAASGLAVIFSKEPPRDPDNPENPDDPNLDRDFDLETQAPPEWRSTLEAAVDVGVLDEQAAARWGRAFARAAREREAEQALKEARYARSMRIARGEEEDEDEDEDR